MTGPRRSCSPAAASSSAATPPATSRSARTGSSTPPPARARASTPSTTASTPTRAPTRPTRAAPCGRRTTAAPATRSGSTASVVKMDPATGFTPSQATANSWLVAYGQRNPWRLTFPGRGTNELWSGDVGASNWEEVNRIPDVTQVTSPINRGWPCYEGSHTGSLVQPGWDALDRPLCESLYTQGRRPSRAPYFSYQTRGPLLTPGEDCENDTSSVSGRRVRLGEQQLPRAVQGCDVLLRLRPLVRVGAREEAERRSRPDRRSSPSCRPPRRRWTWSTGPGGDLYYVDYGLDEDGVPTENAAGVHRIVYTGSNAAPTARIVANPDSGPAPLLVNFDGTTSTDPDGDALTYRWDLDGDGHVRRRRRAHADAAPTPWAPTTSGCGSTTATATPRPRPSRSRPATPRRCSARSPRDATLTWSVGQTINFSATATDAQQGTMPASAFSWNLAIRHCPSDVCHTHNLSTFPGVSSGQLPGARPRVPLAPAADGHRHRQRRPHRLADRPARPEDRRPRRSRARRRAPTVTVNGADHTTPYTETFLQGSRVTITAAPTTGSGSTVAGFASLVGRRRPLPRALRARHRRRPTPRRTTDRPRAWSPNPTSGPAPLAVTYTASGTNAADVTGGFTYAWDLDNDGQYDDGTGTTPGPPTPPPAPGPSASG